VRFAGVTYGGTASGSGGASKEMSPEDAKVAGCLGAAVVAVVVTLIVLHSTGTWPFKKDANAPAAPDATTGVVAPAPPAPVSTTRIEATATGLTFHPVFTRPPAPGSRLALVYRATPSGGAPFDEAVLRDIVIESRYESVAPPPGQYPGATVFLGRRRIPLRPIEDDATGTVLLQSTLPHGGGAGRPGDAPTAADPGWLVVCASKLHDGIHDGRPIVVDYPWARGAAGGPPVADPPRFAVSGGVAEFVPPKEGLSYRFSQLLTPVCRHP
jgi:hypothetical protein